MIQRIQSLYLLVAVVLLCVALSLPMGVFEPQGMAAVSQWYQCGLRTEGHFSLQPVPALLLALSTLLSLITIFLYSKRLLQARLIMISMVLVVCWAVYMGVTLYGQKWGEFHAQWSMVLPIVALVLQWLARLRVLADERLVRSMDRIR